jgi:ergothioneine biosynthesis protein EgtB
LNRVVQLNKSKIIKSFLDTRATTEHLCAHLEPEDCVVQTMPDVSPTKWHLAHTTWFFEQFILKPKLPTYKAFHPQYEYLFNSYYNSIGKMHPRSERGHLTRPLIKEVLSYRKHVNDAILGYIDSIDAEAHDILPLVELGIQHEQQHQELILTDITHVFGSNPLKPTYWNCPVLLAEETPKMTFRSIKKGIHSIGHTGNGFGFDNEFPRHEKLIHGFEIASRLITNAEYMEFMQDGGYARPEFWLSDGWDSVRQEHWCAPLYWEKEGDEWFQFSLNGYGPVNAFTPVCHISFYEADAYARWAGCRLPIEEEWELAFGNEAIEGNFMDNNCFSPLALQKTDTQKTQAYGDVWEWTNSTYAGYPGFKPNPGAIGEYNGKFMNNQRVLKGGSCATAQSHMRASYRNFFYPHQRWQFMGIRLAKDLR